MTYTPEMREMIKVVESTRQKRLNETFPSMSLEERGEVLKAFPCLNCVLDNAMIEILAALLASIKKYSRVSTISLPSLSKFLKPSFLAISLRPSVFE